MYTAKGRVSAGLRAREAQRKEREQLSAEIRAAEARIDELKNSSIGIRQEVNNVAVEVGPAKNVAEVFYGDTSVSGLEKAVRLVIYTIMFVFDPFAIVLLLMAQEEFRRRKEEPIEFPPIEILFPENKEQEQEPEQEVEEKEEVEDEWLIRRGPIAKRVDDEFFEKLDGVKTRQDGRGRHREDPEPK